MLGSVDFDPFEGKDTECVKLAALPKTLCEGSRDIFHHSSPWIQALVYLLLTTYPILLGKATLEVISQRIK